MDLFLPDIQEAPTMDISTIYAARSLPRESLPDSVLDMISKLKISFKPPFRRPYPAKRRPERDDWRESVLVDVVRKVREKDDADYDEVNAIINKLSKQTYIKLVGDVLSRLEKRDEMFRLRVTTLLFDRGIRQNFYAPIMADAYAEIARVYPDALTDLVTQVKMFDTLYDTTNVTILPSSASAGYDDAVIAWTKQKETKRGFAVYVGELYARELIPEDIMSGFVKTVLDDLAETAVLPKTAGHEEHVDALVRFLFAVASKCPLRAPLGALLARPRAETPSLNMKSRFKMEDAMKASFN
jgi:hypothetical protein